MAERTSPEVTHVEAVTHGRLLLRPSTAAAPRGLVMGFHGYGERAEDHLAALEGIPGAERVALAAPQGLHSFYRRDRSVVASWMTRLDRELVIADNLRYVARAVAAAREGLEAGKLPLAFTGFSQGVAMAYRAAAAAEVPLSALVVLAGDVPPDVAAAGAELPPVLVGRGREDEWYTAEKMDADLEILEGLGAEVETCVFDGGHEWGAEFLEAAGEFLGRRLGG